jgi:hypothetical protein
MALKHILCSVTFPPPPENRAVYEIMSNNMVEPEGPQMTSQYGACESCMLHKQSYTHARAHAEIRNTYSFSSAKVICQRAWVLHYAHIARLCYFEFVSYKTVAGAVTCDVT